MTTFQISMSEKITYEVDVDAEDFARLVAEHGPQGLLGLMLDPVEETCAVARSVGVSDREWAIDVPALQGPDGV